MNTQSTNQSQEYSHEILKGAIQNSKYLTDIKFIKLKDVSIQQVADTVYLVRGYKHGENYPAAHEWLVTVVVEGGLYHSFGFTKVNGGNMSAAQFRTAHSFFKKMGLKSEYIRGKHIK